LDIRYFILKCINGSKGDFSYFADLDDRFDYLELYQQLFCYLTNEEDANNFNSGNILMTDIKIETMNTLKESRVLFFEEKIDIFIQGYEMNKPYLDCKK
jgi:hypothetical protein